MKLISPRFGENLWFKCFSSNGKLPIDLYQCMKLTLILGFHEDRKKEKGFFLLHISNDKSASCLKSAGVSRGEQSGSVTHPSSSIPLSLFFLLLSLSFSSLSCSTSSFDLMKRTFLVRWTRSDPDASSVS